jgi:hypothetical protein
MISIIDLDAEDLKGMATAIAMSTRRSAVIRDLGAVEDGAAAMLPDSLVIMVRPDK